ncbi:TIGR03667 family PPOX class F420-dependent oxidoreductase [Millisia brevis]|uniref:TIGR03667 family PPOX class F420-dependent oxidoreductase n=1 Tax=Millisia brevis TaxID=264148 RepID=UPI00082D02BB|nr:TIGR03667 family PPOX class F420-dependent oxidoreductase [Millisia brevis]
MTSALTLSDRVTQRLNDEQIIWLTTVTGAGAPVPTPVWFLRSGDQILVFSQPDTGKLKHTAANSRVALNLNSNDTGGDIAVLTGAAVVDPAGPTDAEWEAYAKKYAWGFPAIGSSPEKFRGDYSVLLRITPDKVRSW